MDPGFYAYFPRRMKYYHQKAKGRRAAPREKERIEMMWTKKEQSFLKDLQNEESVCIDKYGKAAQEACDEKLKGIFDTIKTAEQHHYNTLTQMLDGTIPQQQGQQGKKQGGAQNAKKPKDLKSTASRAGKQQDAYLLSDLLGTEKYVSSVYNTAVFEFSDENARQVLAGIQQQEQEHGKQLSEYMQANNMYC